MLVHVRICYPVQHDARGRVVDGPGPSKARAFSARNQLLAESALAANPTLAIDSLVTWIRVNRPTWRIAGLDTEEGAIK